MERPKNKYEYREQLAQMFINALSEHGLDWKKQWHGVGPSAPFNGITKAKYRGCNMIFLHMASMARGYKDPRWVTMVQIMDKDNKYHPGEKWHLTKGTKAVYVEYWYPYDYENKKALTWDEYKAELDKGRSEEDFTLNTRYTAVFNADAVEGMPKLVVSENLDVKQEDVIDKLSANMGVPICYDGENNAFYRPSEDAIHVPDPKYFESSYAFNSTVLHELAHSTGHPSRLNRPIQNIFGSEAYAFEELIAEMTSCFMSATVMDPDASESAVHMDNHKAYIQSWIKSIKDKPETLIKAVKEAQTAAVYMDYKAELIDEAEYNSVVSNMKVQPVKETKEKINNQAVQSKRVSIKERVERIKEKASQVPDESVVLAKKMNK